VPTRSRIPSSVEYTSVTTYSESRPQIPIISALYPQLNLLTPTPPEKNSWVRHCLASSHYKLPSSPDLVTTHIMAFQHNMIHLDLRKPKMSTFLNNQKLTLGSISQFVEDCFSNKHNAVCAITLHYCHGPASQFTTVIVCSKLHHS
jgi:hypothetical protein